MPPSRKRRPRAPQPTAILPVVAFWTIYVSAGTAQGRPFHHVSLLSLQSWRARIWKIRHRLQHRVSQPQHPCHQQHIAFLPRSIQCRGGTTSSSAAATTAAYADFFDEGMYSDGEGRGSDSHTNNEKQHVSIAEEVSDTYHGKEYQQTHSQYQEENLVPFQGHCGWVAYLRQVAASSRMNAYTASLSLRYTCEINRRLQRGTDVPPAHGNLNDVFRRYLHADLVDDEVTQPLHAEPRQQQQSWDLQKGYGNHYQPDGNSHGWIAPIRRPDPEPNDKNSQLSIFDAPNPRSGGRGVMRWGMDLEHFLEQICVSLDCPEGDIPTILARAFIYLDRACSVETERHLYYNSYVRIPPCPPILPRSVHRLILTAVVLSCRAVREQTGSEYDGAYADHLDLPAITPHILSAMEATMRDALGIEVFYVDQQRLARYLLAWGKTFTGELKENSSSSSDSIASSEEVSADDVDFSIDTL